MGSVHLLETHDVTGLRDEALCDEGAPVILVSTDIDEIVMVVAVNAPHDLYSTCRPAAKQVQDEMARL